MAAQNNIRKEEDLFNDDEPLSKRLRVMKPSHAEYANGATAVVKPSIPADGNLQEGVRVVVQGLESRPQLNGQAGQVLGFHPLHSRWIVSLDDGSKKLITTTNLQLQNQPEISALSTSLIKAETNPDSKDANHCIQSQEQLMKSHFQAVHASALRHIEQSCAKTCAEVSHLRSDVEQRCSIHAQSCLRYCQLSKPKDHEQQRARNHIREELKEEGQAVQVSMERLFSAPIEPAAVLQKEQARVLEEIDSAMRMLGDLRVQTAESFAECVEKLEVDRIATEVSVKALMPGIEELEKFMLYFAQEVENEKSEAERIYGEALQKLEDEEATFVAGNEDPLLNPRFAQVQAELTALKQRRKERSRIEAADVSLIEAWSSMQRVLAFRKDGDARKEPEQTPRQNFWSRLSYFTRPSAASA